MNGKGELGWTKFRPLPRRLELFGERVTRAVVVKAEEKEREVFGTRGANVANCV